MVPLLMAAVRGLAMIARRRGFRVIAIVSAAHFRRASGVRLPDASKGLAVIVAPVMTPVVAIVVVPVVMAHVMPPVPVNFLALIAEITGVMLGLAPLLLGITGRHRAIAVVRVAAIAVVGVAMTIVVAVSVAVIVTMGMMAIPIMVVVIVLVHRATGQEQPQHGNKQGLAKH